MYLKFTSKIKPKCSWHSIWIDKFLKNTVNMYYKIVYTITYMFLIRLPFARSLHGNIHVHWYPENHRMSQKLFNSSFHCIHLILLWSCPPHLLQVITLSLILLYVFNSDMRFCFSNTCLSAECPLWLLPLKYCFVMLSFSFSNPCWLNFEKLPYMATSSNTLYRSMWMYGVTSLSWYADVYNEHHCLDFLRISSGSKPSIFIKSYNSTKPSQMFWISWALSPLSFSKTSVTLNFLNKMRLSGPLKSLYSSVDIQFKI